LPSEHAKRLSIIILNWNTRALLRQCLNSLTSEDVSNDEIIIIDNASTDGSPQMVQETFPQVELLINSKNLGFTIANNQGIKIAHGRYILLLNSDTLASRAALDNLVHFMDTHPGVGACSPRLLRPDGIPQSYAFGKDPTLGYLLARGFNQIVFHRQLHNWSIEKPLEVDWVSGACLMVRREVIDQVGGLDENIFMYFEDNDWCLRIRQAGWKVYYVPQIEITHIGGQSVNQNPKARQAYYKSLAYFYDKHYGVLAKALLKGGLTAYRRLVKN